MSGKSRWNAKAASIMLSEMQRWEIYVYKENSAKQFCKLGV